jgi:Flp pilus assembly pilin Flp
MTSMLSVFMKNEEGQGLTEYALIIVIVVIAVAASVTLFAGILDRDYYTSTAEAVDDAVTQ